MWTVGGTYWDRHCQYRALRRCVCHIYGLVTHSLVVLCFVAVCLRPGSGAGSGAGLCALLCFLRRVYRFTPFLIVMFNLTCGLAAPRTAEWQSSPRQLCIPKVPSFSYRLALCSNQCLASFCQAELVFK